MEDISPEEIIKIDEAIVDRDFQQLRVCELANSSQVKKRIGDGMNKLAISGITKEKFLAYYKYKAHKSLQNADTKIQAIQFSEKTSFFQKRKQKRQDAKKGMEMNDL